MRYYVIERGDAVIGATCASYCLHFTPRHTLLTYAITSATQDAPLRLQSAIMTDVIIDT